MNHILEGAQMEWTITYLKTLHKIYVVASKFSKNHFISEKHTKLKPFKTNFLQNSPLVQRCTSTSDSKCVGNILEEILWKPFQLFLLILNDVSSITKAPSL
jgi:hypothetical protein